MKVTVLGRYGPYAPAGGCCSGYLVQGREGNVMLDCGNGTFSRLQEYLPYWELDGIILSHLHLDHVADCFIARYALETAREKGKRSRPLKVYAPPDPKEIYGLLPYRGSVLVEPLDPGGSLSIGDLSFEFLPTAHSRDCCSIRVQQGGKVLVYSGDTEYFDGLAGFARGCHLFLCEANYLARDLERGRRNHLAASQAAQVARAAGVQRLILTHLHPENPPGDTLAEASREFDRVELAEEGKTLEV